MPQGGEWTGQVEGHAAEVVVAQVQELNNEQNGMCKTITTIHLKPVQLGRLEQAQHQRKLAAPVDRCCECTTQKQLKMGLTGEVGKYFGILPSSSWACG